MLHGVPPWYTNMAAGNQCKHLELTWVSIMCTKQTRMYIITFPNTLTSE